MYYIASANFPYFIQCGRTALHVASAYGHTATAENLIDNCAFIVDQQDYVKKRTLSVSYIFMCAGWLDPTDVCL